MVLNEDDYVTQSKQLSRQVGAAVDLIQLGEQMRSENGGGTGHDYIPTRSS